MKIREKVFITNNYLETQNLGKESARNILEKNRVIALYGDLGSGKTTFVQGLAKGLGIKKRIISPTFIIVRKYELRIKNHESRIINFYHIDLYRIENEKDVESLGIEEILNDSQNIVAIEWAEKIKKLLPKKRIDINFFYEKDDRRKIVFRSQM
ncbi:MAG: tRNA (adenosine(37)-N6)-threonylcarbamoyltransferase complex ATPase subunit type 1 TsaE [Candidatus Levybacteria bacterium]|nr:tRNA (adenosine(37)-N6)-threonylcarbamoyltransferase complex ATPase subunit type 1 TsaE [Candidatus Levybacteria bacterium]